MKLILPHKNRGNINIILLLLLVVISGLFLFYFFKENTILIQKRNTNYPPDYYAPVYFDESSQTHATPQSYESFMQEDVAKGSPNGNDFYNENIVFDSQTYTSKSGDFTVEIKQYRNNSSGMFPCYNDLRIKDKSGKYLNIGELDTVLKILNCNFSANNKGYPYPFSTFFSGWGSNDDSFYVVLDELDKDSEFDNVGFFEVKDAQVKFTQFYLPKNIALFQPSGKYLMNQNADVYDSYGNFVAGMSNEIKKYEKGDTVYVTPRLINNKDVLVASMRVFDDPNYIEYVYFFNEATKKFELVGQKEFEQVGVGCPIYYLDINMDTSELGNFGCIDKETIKVDTTLLK